MKFPIIEGVTFEENPERLKITLSLRQNWLIVGFFTVCLLIWAGMLGKVVLSFFTTHYHLVLIIALVVWLGIWLYFGNVLWTQWQYYAAGREILYLNKEQLTLRRPVSWLGVTQVYDMKHVTPFYFSDKHACPAFDYAYQHVYFGQSLSLEEASPLLAYVNGRFFPNADED